jgi:hypothetical protein
LRFPAVSDDPEWLTERSMGVLARRLASPLAAGTAVCMDLTRISLRDGSGSHQRDCLRLLCDGLRSRLPPALVRLDVSPRGLMFSLRADHPGLGELAKLRQSETLARPQIVVRLPDRLFMTLAGHDDAAAEPWPADPTRLWRGLTELSHRDPGVALILQHTTRQACSLAASERSDAALPNSLFEVRADTAWLAVRLNLARLRLCARQGGVAAIRRLLRAGLRLADNLVDQLDWASPEIGQDALLNRRLALHVDGIGDLIDQCRLDPATFQSVRLATRWANLLRRIMVRESNALARERGPFPGLEIRDLECTLAQRYGVEHAERLLRQSRLRHRHLLVLSPYAVFPCRAARHALPAYLHLLPVMRSADTVAMYGHGLRGTLPLATFQRLLQMSWAIARNRP